MNTKQLIAALHKIPAPRNGRKLWYIVDGIARLFSLDDLVSERPKSALKRHRFVMDAEYSDVCGRCGEGILAHRSELRRGRHSYVSSEGA